MRVLIFTLILGLFIQVTFADVDRDRDACLQCHVEIDEDLDNPIITHYENDIHYEKGLSCADCHGGNPEAWDDEDKAMWDSESFIEDMSKMDEVKMCGKCHSDPTFMRQYAVSVETDQLAQYWTSQHGIKLQEGSEIVATCTSCHDVHGIYPVSDPRSKVYPLNIPNTCSHCHSDENVMKDSGLPTDQMDDYKTSVHGIALIENQDLGSPACNDCHGNHGAAPPDVGHISDICGTCHINNKDLFEKSPLQPAFMENGLGQCEGCHNNHAVEYPTEEFLNWDNNAVCIKCHEDADKDSKVVKMAGSFYETISGLKTGIELADSLLNNAEEKGMEVSDYYYNLEEAHRTLIQAKTAIHSFDVETVNEIAAPGKKEIEASIAGANQAIKDWVFRRKGLFVFSLIISLVAIALYLKIREMEKPD